LLLDLVDKFYALNLEILVFTVFAVIANGLSYQLLIKVTNYSAFISVLFINVRTDLAIYF